MTLFSLFFKWGGMGAVNLLQINNTKRNKKNMSASESEEVLAGEQLLAHCYERALLSGVCDNLVIATPDQEIIEWANQFKIPSILTSHSHKRATERAKETLDKEK
mgnify:CR=1 FL=1